MSATLALLAVLAVQDTTGLSARATAMLADFPPPRNGEVTIATRFSTRSAWIGEQVELVTAAWFPRELRDRLRRPPTLRAPTLGGLWSAPAQTTPLLAGSRMVNGEMFDLFVAHQTLFPLGAGTIESPPAVLTYAVPTSVSFFAPEERQTLSSRPTSLEVRPIPARLTRALGSGPTARAIRMAWRAPPEGLRVDTPARVELVMTGEGNVTLWPEPTVAWPSSLRVYPEPVEQAIRRPEGRIAGEKRFRFTVVADSAGVVTLPAIRYPYFDPASASVRVANSPGVSLAVRPTLGRQDRPLLAVARDAAPAWSSRVVRDGWPALLVLAVLPFLPRRRRRPPPAVVSHPQSPEAILRRALGTPVDAAPDRVERALRHRGVPSDQAREVAAWMARHHRERYGPAGGAPGAPPAALDAVLTRLRRAGQRIAVLLLLATPLAAQADDPITRYRGGDLPGAERGFTAAAERAPLAAGHWHNLAAARWAAGDDVGAAAAWLRALELAPRDRAIRAAWNQAGTVPTEIRRRAPLIPASRDELLLAALGAWVVAVLGWRLSHRRVALVAGGLCLAFALPAMQRTLKEQEPILLVRPGSTLRVSPIRSAPALAAAPAWSVARATATAPGWLLVELRGSARGWLPIGAVAPVGALD